MVKNIPPGGINILRRRERGAVLNKCIFIHFCRSGMGGDADLVRRLPIESVGTIVDEVGPCEKMGPLKKIPPASRKNRGPLKNTGGGLKDAVRRYTTPIMGSIYSMVTIEKTHGFVFIAWIRTI